MNTTNVDDPEYFHRVIDCQWSCPAHTPVPEYIRLIGERRYADAYMINWVSNVFPGVLGRTCDRPCEPACRRGRVESGAQQQAEPVAICRLKRVAADNKGDISHRLPQAPSSNGRRVACVGGGPASLTVARDLATLGYQVTVFDSEAKAGGFIRSQIPRFRLPERVIDEECGYVFDLGVEFRANTYIQSLRQLLTEPFDAIFVGSGAPRGRDLDIPGRSEASAKAHIGISWLASVSFGHIDSIGERVIVLGGGNTAMDCCRSAKRLGAKEVTVVVRSGFDEMKASPWEKEDAMHEGIPILNYHVPKRFVLEGKRLVGMAFDKVSARIDPKGQRILESTGEDEVIIPCDEVLIAVGQENHFPWIEKDIGIEFDRWGIPVLGKNSFQSTLPQVFFGGDAAMGPKNIITAVAQGHEAAISIDLFLSGASTDNRPAPKSNLLSQKMGIHEWSYDNDVSNDARFKVPWAKAEKALANIRVEVELGFDEATALKEAQRCLNCDIQTVFTHETCIECDACLDICPMDSLTIVEAAPEEQLRSQLRAPAQNMQQAIYASATLKSGRIMVKDEDVCLHCGLCAERCPTGAWDMAKFRYDPAKAANLENFTLLHTT